MRTALENRNDVNVVLLAYNTPGSNAISEYYNGIFVKLTRSQAERDLISFTQSTNTQIVGYPADYGTLTYFLRVDKNSTGDIFEIVTQLNSLNKVEHAEIDVPVIPLRKRPDQQNLAIQSFWLH